MTDSANGPLTTDTFNLQGTGLVPADPDGLVERWLAGLGIAAPLNVVTVPTRASLPGRENRWVILRQVPAVGAMAQFVSPTK